MRINYLILVVCTFLIIGCAKDELPYYLGDNSISFFINANEKDSLDYSFAMNLTSKELDTIPVKMRIQGYVSDKDRKAKVVAIEGTTAREGIDFILPEAIIPAGSQIIKYPLIIKSTPIMKDKSLRIVLKIEETEDFKVGTLGVEVGNTKSIPVYKVNVSNIILDNARWSDTSDQFKYFGKYSYEKYRFMVETLGVTDFSSTSIGFYGLYNYPLILRQKLAEHEAIHGPILIYKDGKETGEFVKF